MSDDRVGHRSINGRAPSLHAEAACLSRLSKHNCSGHTIYSLAFQINDDGELNLCMARPCFHCTQQIMKYGITNIVYSDTTGSLIKIKINDLMIQATPSTGFRLLLTNKNNRIPRLYIRNEQTYNEIINRTKTIEVRLNKGFPTQLMNGTVIQLMYAHESCFAMIISIRKFTSFRNCLLKMGFENITPNCSNIKEAERRLYSYYQKSAEKHHNVLAFSLYVK